MKYLIALVVCTCTYYLVRGVANFVAWVLALHDQERIERED